jgi:hypothetical protein
VLGVSTDTVFVHRAWINTPRENDGVGELNFPLASDPTLQVSRDYCHENMPTIAEWRDAYAERGLRVVAIHLPREEADTDVARVRDDVTRMQITEPCGVDNTVAVADAFDNRYVPAYFLFDREGLLRSRSAGDAGLGLLKGALARQFGET